MILYSSSGTATTRQNFRSPQVICLVQSCLHLRLLTARDSQCLLLLLAITAGPGPASSLDGENIVFGRVLEGLDTMSEILQVKRFGPASSTDRVAAFNALAGLLRDKRAAQAKARWGRPLKSIVITSSGVMDA